MPAIPESAYRQVEKRLRERYTAEARAEQRLYEAQARAYSVTSPALDKDRVQTTGQGSRVEKSAAAILQAEEQLNAARKWEKVFQLLDKTFPLSTPEGKAAHLVYVRGYTKKAAAQIERCKQDTLAARISTYICHGALFAAADGLIRIREGEE